MVIASLLLVIGIGIGFLLVMDNEEEEWVVSSAETKSHTPRSRSKEKKVEKRDDASLAKRISTYMQRMGILEYKQNLEAAGFALYNLDGEEIRLEDFRGKVVFLNFWATWCGPCRMEMPAMERLYGEFRDQNFAMLAVSIDHEDAEVVAEFANSFGLSFPILLDPGESVSSMYGVHSIPTTYLINSDGILIGIAHGARDWDNKTARNLIRALIETSQRFKP